jgi:hypothetical protein
MPVLLLINILVGPATIWVLIDLGTEDNFLNASWAKKYLLTASMRLSQAEAIDGQTIQSLWTTESVTYFVRQQWRREDQYVTG